MAFFLSSIAATHPYEFDYPCKELTKVSEKYQKYWYADNSVYYGYNLSCGRFGTNMAITCVQRRILELVFLHSYMKKSYFTYSRVCACLWVKNCYRAHDNCRHIQFRKFLAYQLWSRHRDKTELH